MGRGAASRAHAACVGPKRCSDRVLRDHGGEAATRRRLRASPRRGAAADRPFPAAGARCAEGLRVLDEHGFQALRIHLARWNRRSAVRLLATQRQSARHRFCARGWATAPSRGVLDPGILSLLLRLRSCRRDGLCRQYRVRSGPPWSRPCALRLHERSGRPPHRVVQYSLPGHGHRERAGALGCKPRHAASLATAGTGAMVRGGQPFCRGCAARSRAQRRADESGKIHRRWHAVKKTDLEMFDRSRRVLAALSLPCGERVGRGGWLYSEALAPHPIPSLWEREPTGFAGAISVELHCHWSNNPASAAAASQSLASSLIMAANSAGVLAMLSSPFSPSTCCTSVELRMRTTSSCKRAVIAGARFGGPSKPIQVRTGTKPGISSVMVGTFGSLA